MKAILTYFVLILSAFKTFAADQYQYSATVIDIKEDQIVYQHNPYLKLLPASNQKILTTLVGLKVLPKQQQYETSFFYTGNIVKKVLHGDLYVKFVGDIYLTKIEFLEALTELRGVLKEIKGQIIIDDSGFDAETHSPGTTLDQSKFCFGAPISQIILDKNCFKIALDDRKVIKSEGYVLYNNSVRKVAEKYCDFDLYELGGNHYELSGCNDSGIKVLNVGVTDVRKLAESLLREHLQFKGKIKFERMVKDAMPMDMGITRVVELDTLLTEMMLESDNVIADNVFKEVGRIRSNKKSTWSNSANAFKEVLNELGGDKGLDLSEIVIKDGSGLSRKNLISSNFMANMLRIAYQDPELSDRFLSLFVNCNRYKTHKMCDKDLRNVYFKTGSMDNVSALSGYFFKSDKPYSFSILFNNFTVPSNEVIDKQIEIIKLVRD